MRSKNNIIAVLAFYCLLLTANCSLLYAQWPTTVEGAIIVDNGIYPIMSVDPADHSVTVAYIRADFNQIRAKKYDQYGYPMWGGNYKIIADTININVLSIWQYSGWGRVLPDDSGGVIVCWMDFRHSTFDPNMGDPQNNEIYIQRLDCAGQSRFGEDGQRISTHASNGMKELINMNKDYHGGYIIGFRYDTIYNMSTTLRIDKQGNILWKRFFAMPYYEYHLTDTDGNSFISYGGPIGQNYYRTKLSYNNQLLWQDTLNGVIYGNYQTSFSDLRGGVIVADNRYDNPTYTIFVNRVDSSGAYVFGNGIDIANGTTAIECVSDGAGGIYISFSSYGGKIQRVDINGNIIYNFGGVSPCNGICNGLSAIVSDLSNGLLAIYTVVLSPPNRSFFVQKIDSSGNRLWDSLGVIMYESSNDFFPYYSYKSTDGKNGLLYCWNELANGLEIRLKQLSYSGIIGDTNTVAIKESKITQKAFYLTQNYPNPFNNSTTIKYQLKNGGKVQLKLYNILGQEVKTLVNEFKQEGIHYYQLNMNHFTSGVYIYRLITDKGIKSKKLLYIK